MITVAIDNETFLIERLEPSPPVVCSAFCTDRTDAVLFVNSDPALKQSWLNVLQDDNYEIVGMNIAYDMATIIATYPDLLPLVFAKYQKNLVTDIAIRQQLCVIATQPTSDTIKNHSLASLVSLIFDEDIAGKKGPGIWRLRYSELDGVPIADWPIEAINYAKNDAIWTWKIWDEQNEAQEIIHYEHERAYIDFCLRLISTYGMRTSGGTVMACKIRHLMTIEALTPDLLAAGVLLQKGGKLTKSTKKTRELVIAGCRENGREIPLTKTGQNVCDGRSGDPTDTDLARYAATDKAACLSAGSEILKKRIDYSSAEKMLSTYIPVLERGIDGPLTTRFGMAATGRTTSSAPRKPLVGTNLQNAPRDGGIRECFVPRAGRVYLAADYGGAELHTLAEICADRVGYSVLGDRLNAGDDIHVYTASKLLGLSYDEALGRYVNSDPALKDARQSAKAANFGFPGGMREAAFMRDQLKNWGVFWKYEDAKKLRDAWLEAFPEIEEYSKLCASHLNIDSGTVIKMPFSNMHRLVTTPNMASNTPFQSLAGVGALRAVCAVTSETMTDRTSVLYGSRICNFIHDELMLEIPDDDLKHERAMRVKKIMEYEFNVVVPRYPVMVEPVLMDRWSKKAVPFWEPGGRLGLWRS